MMLRKKYKISIIVVLSLLVLLASFLTLKSVQAEEVIKPSNLMNADTGISGFVDNYSIGAQEGSINYSGLFVKTNSSRSTVSYKNVIDAKTLDKKDALIEMQFLGAGEQGYAKGTTAALYLTDADDPTNRIGVGFYPSNDLGEAANGGETYFRVIYNGQSVSYDVKRERHWINNYGLCALGRSLYPGKFGVGAGKSPTLIRFDYDEKAFYLDTHEGTTIILDLDLPLPVGEDALWEGFRDDRCILSFEIEYESAKNGGFVIGELLGRSLKTNSFNLSENSPSAIITAPDGHTVESLPKAEVGTPYALPRLDTFDFLYGTADVSVKAYRRSVDVTSELVDGSLVATNVGDVRLVYTAINKDGKTARAETTITVIKELAPYAYSKSNDDCPVLGEYFDVPTITVTGGSGTLYVTETIMYNGEELDLSKGRKVLIDEVGSISIFLEVQGYTGSKQSTLFLYSVDLNKACIVVNGMPFSVNTGKKLIIPDFKIIQNDGTETNKKVYVGDTDVTNSMSYDVTEEKGTTLSVKFCGGTGDSYNEIIYDVKVVSDTYSLSDYVYVVDGEATVTDSHEKEAVVFKATSDATVRFAYPVSLYNLNLNFDYDGSYTNSIDIIFTGYENRSDSMFFRLTYLSADTSSLTVNGKGSQYVVPVGFTNLSSYEFVFQNNSGEIYFANNLIGVFEPLKSAGVVVDIRLNGLTNESELLIKKLSNQSYNPKAYLMGDNVSAYVYIDGVIEKYKQVTSINAFMVIPAAEAYDALSDGAQVSLVITSPSKEKIYTGDIFNPYKLELSEYGMYVISYAVKDAKGNSTNFNYNVELIDRVNPVITVKNRPDTLFKVGDTLEISSVEVSDNYDESPTVEVFLKNNVTGAVVLISDSSYQLQSKGKYTLVYKVYDASYNYASIEYQIEVVE